jgi:hypothetical protein
MARNGCLDFYRPQAPPVKHVIIKLTMASSLANYRFSETLGGIGKRHDSTASPPQLVLTRHSEFTQISL